MDIISINIATNKTIAKLKDEGIEALTLIGADGKQYELTVDSKGALAVTVKGGDTGNEDTGGGTVAGFTVEFNTQGELPDYAIGELTLKYVSEKVPARKQLENSEIFCSPGEGTYTFYATDVRDAEAMWMASYRPDYGESEVGTLVAIVHSPNSDNLPVGIYVNCYALNSECGGGDCTITFPEVTA
jgi:hypothetical protein